MSRTGVETRESRWEFLNDEHGFAQTVANSAAKALNADGISLTATPANAEGVYNLGLINPFLISNLLAVEFLFKLTAVHAGSEIGLGISNGATDEDLPSHACKSYLLFTNLLPSYRNDDGTTDSTLTYTEGNTVATDKWMRLCLSFDEAVQTMSPPNTSNGQVVTVRLSEGTAGSTDALYNRELTFSGQIVLAAAASTAVSPVVWTHNTTGSTNATGITLREICVKHTQVR